MTDKIVKPNVTVEETEKIKQNTSLKGNGYRGIRDDTLKVFGVRTEYDESTGDVVARYYPCTKDGELSGWKRRGHPKNFGGSIGNTGNTCDMFGQFKFKNGGKVCLIVGGEEDQLAAYQMLKDYYVSKGWDYEPAVVSPTVGETGCESQVSKQYAWFNKHDKIVIGMDNDEAGKKAIEKLVKVLPKGKVFTAEWSMKDPNKMLEEDQSKKFINDFYSAKQFIPIDILPSSALYDRIISQSSIPKVPFPPFMGDLNSMFVGGMSLGYIYNIAADTGVGKTTFVNEMIYYWIFNSPHKVGIVSMELDAGQYGEVLLSRHLKKKLALIDGFDNKLEYLATPEVVEKSNDLMYNTDGTARFFLLDNRDGSIEEIQNTIEELVVTCGCKIIVLDPLQDILDGLSNEDQSLYMKWSKGFIKSHGVSFIYINHMRKSENSGEMDIMGSSTIIKSAGATIILKRDKMADDLVKRNTTEILVPKNRVTGLTGPAGATYYENSTHTLWNLDNWLNENS